MCCAVLLLAEQIRIDDSMRMEIRFDSKYADAAAQGTQRCSSNTELAHQLRHQWHCVKGSFVGGVGMTHVRSHKGEPWNDTADSIAEAAKNGCSVPNSRTELEGWVMSFRGSRLVQLGHVLRCQRVKSGKTSLRNSKTRFWKKAEPKEMGSLRIATVESSHAQPGRREGGEWHF